MQQSGTPNSSSDPALVAPPIITDPGPEYAPDTRPFQGIPGIERTEQGRLWATWYGGGPGEGPHNYVMLSTSDDDGHTWSNVALVVDPPGEVRAFDPVLWIDPLDRMWLFWAQAWEMWDGRGGVWAIVSENPDSANPQWSDPRRLCDGVMMNKPLALSNGDWLLPAAVWSNEPNVDEEHVREAEHGSASHVIASRDQGTTWKYRGGVDIPGRRCDEHHVVERSDGTLWLLARTTYGIGQSFSEDGGRTWSEPEQSWIPHIPTARFFIRRLNSGHLILVKHSPIDGRSRSHLSAYLSEDDGRTWQGGLVLDERSSVSYPDGVEAEDGTIYIIYDFQRAGAKEILMATFTEADVLAKQAVSDHVRRRVVVNRATGEPEEDEINLVDNADAEPVVAGPPATLSISDGDQVAPFELKETIFTNRDYVIEDVPAALQGARFVRGSIDQTDVAVKEEGVVYAITPTPERNNDSVELALLRQGFERANVREFVLFGGSVANACTTFQKRWAAGETIEFGKWGIILLPED